MTGISAPSLGVCARPGGSWRYAQLDDPKECHPEASGDGEDGDAAIPTDDGDTAQTENKLHPADGVRLSDNDEASYEERVSEEPEGEEFEEHKGEVSKGEPGSLSICQRDHSDSTASVAGILAELERLRHENADLKSLVATLQSSSSRLGVGANDSENSIDIEVAQAIAAKVDRGPGKLLYAPRDLFLVYSVKLAECSAYYGFAFIYVSYISEEFGLDDEQAGNLYAAYGLMSTVFGISMGFLIDRMGVRRSMMFGCMMSFCARLACTFTTSTWWMCFISVTLFPLGAAFGVPVLALGVRRYTHQDNRGFAFSVFYAVLCLATLCGSLIINRVRTWYPNGTVIFDHKITWMRLVLCCCTVLTAYTMLASYFVRDIQVLSDKDLEERAFCCYKPLPLDIRASLKAIISQPRFWRLTAVTLIFCGVRTTFRHLDATFPKYFTRTFGEHAPFELIVSVDPVVSFFLSPIATWLLLKYEVKFDQTLLWGSFISGISVFFMAVHESYSSAIAFVLVLAIGESIWSPKLYEFSTMVAPEGREGMYVAITAAPIYLASVPVGALSGILLDNFCAKDAPPSQRQGQLLWFIIGCTAFASPILLLTFKKHLLKPGDDAPPTADEQELGVGEHRRPGHSRLPGVDKDFASEWTTVKKAEVPAADDDQGAQLAATTMGHGSAGSNDGSEDDASLSEPRGE